MPSSAALRSSSARSAAGFPGGQVRPLPRLQLPGDEALQRARRLEEAAVAGGQVGLPIDLEDLALHGQALDLGGGSRWELDAAGLGGRDLIVRKLQRHSHAD